MTLTQVCYMMQAVAMTILVLMNQIEVWHIVVLSVFNGIVTAFDAPARQSLVIDLIDNPDDLGNAIALNSAIFNGARLVGPAIAGIAIAALGEGVCFLLNSLSFLAVIGALLQIRIPPRPVRTANQDFQKSFREGFQYTFQSMPIRTLILLLAVLSLAGLPFIVLLPAYAKEILQGGSDTLGYLMSSLGAGALLSALYMASRKTLVGLGKIISGSIGILGMAIVLASFSHSRVLSYVACFFGGLSMILLLSAINTLLQTLTDEDKRGRVMSFYAMAVMGTTPIGNLLTGSLASGIGIPHTLLICGIVTLIAGIWFFLNLGALRKQIHPIYITKGILPGIPEN
jgi:MFS family permease